MQKYGEDRVMDSPISETAILGAGIGSAIVGMRPVVEIMNIDFLPVCLDQLVNQAAKMRYMFGGQCKIPLVVRTTCGAGRGGAAHHAQATHAAYMHFPGLKIVAAGTPHDVKGLLLTAIEDENPVLFIEDKMMYNTKDEVPEGYYTVPFGKAAIRHEGKDITVVATMRMGYKAVAVAKEMAEKGISVEVIDPRTLCPLDEETILTLLQKDREDGDRGRGAPGWELRQRGDRHHRRESGGIYSGAHFEGDRASDLCSVFARSGEGSLHPE